MELGELAYKFGQLLGVIILIFLVERFVKWLNSAENKPNKKEIRIIDPERLHEQPLDKAYGKNYNKYNKTYYYGQSGATGLREAQKKLELKGKKVKYWRLVASHSDFSLDEYIPIYYQRRKKKVKK